MLKCCLANSVTLNEICSFLLIIYIHYFSQYLMYFTCFCDADFKWKWNGGHIDLWTQLFPWDFVAGYKGTLIKCASCNCSIGTVTSAYWNFFVPLVWRGEWSGMGSPKGRCSLALRQVSCLTPGKCCLCQHQSLGWVAQRWISVMKEVYVSMVNFVREIYREPFFPYI